MSKIIGILATVDSEKNTKLSQFYISAIEHSGAIPVVLPYSEENRTIDGFIDLCDGFLFSGGVDIDPKYYGEEQMPFCGEIQSYRDEFELKIFKKIIDKGKPILAICRGAQLVNVALGGTLFQDIPSQTSATINHRQTEDTLSFSHSVKVLFGTPLYDLINKESLPANSFHHQAIKELGNGLRAMAISDDGIIEAVWLDGKNYLRAYQWHPERVFDKSTENKMIFDDFIKACL